MSSYEKYLKYKNKYLHLKEKISSNQIGGGAWSTFSNGNDNSKDMMTTYKFSQYDDDKMIYFKDIKSTNIGLQKMFNDFDNEIKNKNSNFNKNTDASIYNLNYSYLGVVIELLLNLYPVPKKYLVRALIHAYREYIRIYITKESSGWESYICRLNSLRYEILLLNYAINTGTPISLSEEFINIECDTANEVIWESDIIRFINGLIDNKNSNIVDHIFLEHKEIKPKYDFYKYEYVPILNPLILNPGTIMKGYGDSKSASFFIVHEKNNQRTWKHYDSYEDVSIGYLPIDILYDIYGDVITTINKKDIRKL